MQEDLAALKKGEAPTGFKLEKESEKEASSTASATGPKITPPPPLAAPRAELGRLEKSRTLAGSAPLPARSPASSSPTPTPSIGPTVKPSLGIPPVGGLGKIGEIMGKFGGLGGFGSRKIIFGGLAGIVVLVIIIFLFVLREPSVPEATFTPSPSISSTPTTAPGTSDIENFLTSGSVNLAAGVDIFTRLHARFDNTPVDKNSLAQNGPGIYKISDPQTNQRYSFSSFLSSALVNFTGETLAAVDNNTLYLTLMIKADGSYSDGMVVKLKSSPGIQEILRRLESNLSVNLKDLFGLDVNKAASIDFLDNTYQGIGVRYRNFPDPLKTIDYSVVTTKTGSSYLVFANSREHIYAIIDKLK